MKKYFYKCYYNCGSWGILAKDTPLRNPNQVSQICEKLEIISPVKYCLYWVWGWCIDLKMRWKRE